MISILEALVNSQMYPKTDKLPPDRYAPWLKKYPSKYILAKGNSSDYDFFGSKEKPTWLTPKPETEETRRQKIVPINRKST